MKQGLYRRDVEYYDKIYSYKDYKAESRFIDKAIKKFCKSSGKRVLDIPIGTGNHSVWLKKFGYKITGIDINKQMLALAKRKLKSIRLIKADMKNFRLEEKFDIIICMFSSINYNKDYKELESTLRNFHNHLESGGVVIFDIGFYPFKPELSNWIDTFRIKDLQLARFSKVKKTGGRLALKFYLVVKKNNEIKILKDEHNLGYLEPKKIKKIMKNLGFRILVFDNFTFNPYTYKKKSVKPVFVGIKPLY